MPPATAGALDRGDQRLVEQEALQQRLDDARGDARTCSRRRFSERVAGVRLGHRLEVGAGAEAAAGAGEDRHPDVGVGVDLVPRLAHALHHRRRQRVAALGPVHGERRARARRARRAGAGRRASRSLASRHGFVVPHDPHGEELRGAAVGVAERGAGAVDLVLAGLAAHLQRGLGEAQHARRADRVRRQHAARAVHRAGRRRSRSRRSRSASSPRPSAAKPRFSIHIGSYQLNGT